MAERVKVDNERNECTYTCVKGYDDDLMIDMNRRSINLLDLPDELLLLIMKRMKRNDILYSLFGVNERLDRLAASTAHTSTVNFTDLSSTDGHICMARDVLDRFCFVIMPRICHNVQTLILDHWTMERVLLACKYPALRSVVFSNFHPDTVLNCLKDGSLIACLFKEQVTYISVINTKHESSNESFTNAVIRIFDLCNNLIELDAGGYGVNSSLSINSRPVYTCFSSSLRFICVKVASFDDCLCLLDGRLDKLSSFDVKIDFVSETPSLVNNTRLLPNLTILSISSNDARGYDRQVLPLIRRMPNLKELTLDLTVIRLTFIDGVHLTNEILTRLPQLTKFIIHIYTIMPLIDSHDHRSTDDVQKTFNHWKHGRVNCHVNYFADKAGQCHIYSVPYSMERISGVTNSFLGSSFHLVVDLRLFDVRPFEHVYFNWISRSVPLLKHLSINNKTQQEQNVQIESFSQNSNSVNHFPRLVSITLIQAHTDYAMELLCQTKSHVSRLSSLRINYEKLVTVTDNFTNQLTRVNCAQLKRLLMEEQMVYPNHFYQYFPFL